METRLILGLQSISRDVADNVSLPGRLDPTMGLITYSFVLYLQHGRHDVKCKPSIKLINRVLHDYAVKNKSHVGVCNIHACRICSGSKNILYVLLKTRAGFISIHGSGLQFSLVFYRTIGLLHLLF